MRMSAGIYDTVQKACINHSPVGCAIQNRNALYVVLEHDGDAEGACVCFYYPKTKNIWGANCRGGYYRSHCCITSGERNEFVLVGWEGDVFAQHGLKEDGKPNLIEESHIEIQNNCPITRVRGIAGKAYISAHWRTVFRREGVDEWTCLYGNDPKQIEQWQEDGVELGFNDIGGFSENDIYACGGEGDLFHFDGKVWKNLDCPTNADLKSLCCAPNGKVYIGCSHGMLIEGRDEKWKVLDVRAPDVNISDMAWYRDQLYLACGGDGLYVFDQKDIQPAPGLRSLGSMVTEQSQFSDDEKHALIEAGADQGIVEFMDRLSLDGDDDFMLAPASIHTLSTDGEILLVAGTDEVVAFDGQEWKVLFAPHGTDRGGEL